MANASGTSEGKRRLRFGIKTSPQFTTYQDVLRVWREADEVPRIAHAWVFDHFVPRVLSDDPSGPVLESWTLLSALAAQTSRLRLGVMVSGNTFRHPAVLAKMAATVDHVAHGRLDVGIGAGWMPAEHAMYGIPLPAPVERIQRLGEACEVMRRLWTEEVATFAGRYYTLREARCEPKPVQQPHPPLVIGGSGERRTLQVVAQYANIWNFEVAPTEMFTDAPIERFAHKNAVLDAYCADIGREPTEIERSVQLFADPPTLSGTREMLARFIAAGATHLILMLRPPYPPGVAWRLAEEVIEPLLG